MTTIQFAIAAGSGRFSKEAKYLIRSIKQNVRMEYGVSIFLPTSEKSDIDESTLEFFNRTGSVTTGELPIQNNPMSAKQAALQQAEKENKDWNILLDTDTLLLGNLEGILNYYSKSNILVSPEHGGWEYWANSDSTHRWNEIYELIGSEFPGFIMNSTVDDSPIPPYWNGGVVMASSSISNDWLNLIRKVLSLYGSDTYYADQIALSLVTKKFGVSALPYRFNYPFYMHVRLPSETKIIHYDSLWHMGRVLNPTMRKKIRAIGILDDMSVPSTYSSLPAIFKGVCVRLFRELVRKQKTRLTNDYHDITE